MAADPALRAIGYFRDVRLELGKGAVEEWSCPENLVIGVSNGKVCAVFPIRQWRMMGLGALGNGN